MSHHPRIVLATTLVAALVAACTGGGASPAASSPAAYPSSSAAPSATPAASPVPLVVGLGYIPSVQFAQFYLADRKGYYRDAGLEVELQNKIDPDLVTLVGQGSIDIGSADGTSVIPAVAQGIPVRYVATIYGTSPNVVFAKAAAGIASAASGASRASPWACNPASLISRTNSRALPSAMGGSLASSSMMALSTPHPASAASTTLDSRSAAT